VSEEVCRTHNIQLFVLPPKSPKLNGHVERMQRTFKDEFYTRPLPSLIPELQRELDAYLEYYNRERPQTAWPPWSTWLGCKPSIPQPKSRWVRW